MADRAADKPAPKHPPKVLIRAERFNVLAEGPSILQRTPEELLEGPTVAINWAMQLHSWRGFPVDVWSCIDGPKRLWAPVAIHAPRHFIIWSKPGHANRFKNLMGSRHDDVQIDLGEPLHHTDFPWPTVAGSGLNHGKTIFYTIAMCVLSGAKHIRLMGCDMTGNGNVFTGWMPEEQKKDRDRWDAERKWMEETICECASNGVRVELFNPTT